MRSGAPCPQSSSSVHRILTEAAAVALAALEVPRGATVVARWLVGASLLVAMPRESGASAATVPHVVLTTGMNLGHWFPGTPQAVVGTTPVIM